MDCNVCISLSLRFTNPNCTPSSNTAKVRSTDCVKLVLIKYGDRPHTDYKEKYLMIGNSSADELAAKRAGIDFHLIDFFNKY